MNMGNILVVGIGGFLIYRYVKKREADLRAKLADLAKTKIVNVYEDPNKDNWKSAA